MWGKGKGWKGGKGYTPYAKKGLPDEELRKLGEDIKALVASHPQGLRMSALPPELLASSGANLKELAKKGGYQKTKELLRAVPSEYFELRGHPQQPLETMVHPTEGHLKALEPPLPPLPEVAGEAPVMRAARMAEHRLEHERRCRQLREGGGAVPGGAASKAGAMSWRDKITAIRSRTMTGTANGLPKEELLKIAECLKECLTADPKAATKGIQMGLVPQVLLVRHKVNLRELRERGGYFSQRSLIQALPQGYFEVRENPATHTRDIILFPLQGDAVAADTAPRTRLLGGAPAPAAAAAAAAPAAVAWAPAAGQAAEAQWGSSWLPVTVTAVAADGSTADVQWETGELSLALERSLLRPPRQVVVADD